MFCTGVPGLGFVDVVAVAAALGGRTADAQRVLSFEAAPESVPAVSPSLVTLRARTRDEFDADTFEFRLAVEVDTECATDEFDESEPEASAKAAPAVAVASAVPTPKATANAPTRPMLIA